jgi:hypothetical protein
MAFKPTQPQSIGGVLDVAFQVYKVSLSKVWPICLLLVVGSLPPSLYMLFKGGTALAAAASGDVNAYAKGIFLDPAYWLSYLISLLIVTCSMGAIYLKQDALAAGAELPLARALSTALRRTPSMFLSMILFGIAVVVGCVLLVIPGLILMVSLMLGGAVIVLEGSGPAAGLLRSHKLIWGHWWRTSAILTVGFIIVMVIYMALAFVVGMVTPLVARGADPFAFGLINGMLLSVFIQVLVMPFFLALILSLYWDLKLRREGGDLAARLDALSPA